MRVLHLVQSLAHGGQERIVLDIVKTAPTGTQVGIVVGRRGGALEQLAIESGSTVLQVPTRGLAARAVALRRILEVQKPDVLHAHNAWSVILAATALPLGRPPFAMIATRHGDWLPTNPIGRLQFRLACRRFDAIASVSAASASSALLKGYVRPGQSLVAPNGIDLSAISIVPDSVPCHRPTTLLFVGRLERIKGLDVLLPAIGILRDRGTLVSLRVIGEGSERRALEAMSRTLGLESQVEFTGALLDVRPYLRLSAFGVLPSRSEGQSVSVMEMMAAGLPVIATAVGGTPELVTHGITGYLAPPEDSTGLADTIGVALHDRENNSDLGARARAYALDHFSAEAMQARYQSAYVNAMTGAGIGVSR